MNKSPITPPPGTSGCLEAVIEGVAVGWAKCTSTPLVKPIVEILCDGYPVAFDRADVFRPDKRQTQSTDYVDDACCGFEIHLPRVALLRGKVFTARVANYEEPLQGEIRVGVSAVANSTINASTDDERTKDCTSENQTNATGQAPSLRTLSGEVYLRGGLTLAGWVQPLNYRAAPVVLRLFDGDTLLKEIVADEVIPVQEGGDIPPTVRGFTARLPIQLADGSVHSIRVVDDENRELKGSPVTVAAWQRGSEYFLRYLADMESVPTPVREGLLALAKTSARLGYCLPASVDFDDYEAWRQAFPNPNASLEKPLNFTVIIYGEGNLERSEASLSHQGVALNAVYCPDGVIGEAILKDTDAVAFLQAGDQLSPYALSHMAQALTTGALVAYSDSEQQINGQWQPWFKPNWDPDLLLSQAYVFGLLAMRCDAMQFDRAESDLLAMAVQTLAAAGNRITHLPYILYRQYDAPEAGAAPVNPLQITTRLQHWPALKQLAGHLVPQAKRPWLRHIRLPRPQDIPTVSIIIPTRDRKDLLERAIETLLAKTQYPNIEIIIADNDSTCSETLDYLAQLEQRGITVLPAPGPFNYSRINNQAVAQAKGEIICLLNNDVEIIDGQWLDEMVALLMRPDTGVVGAKLLWSNGMVQHGGVILGQDGSAIHIGNRWHRDDLGYCARNLVVQRNSVVTAACFVLRREDFFAVGGLNETAFPVAFNDVDLCLKIGVLGKAVVWTPEAMLYHHESASRGKDELPEKAARARRELENLRQRWGAILLNDPTYNPNLNRDGDPFRGLAMPPYQTAHLSSSHTGAQPAQITPIQEHFE